MRYLSLFSGIEAATVAWHPLGWECVAVAEIEPFPCAVLAHHYPNVPNLGDVTKITEADIAALGEIDVVVFGSPCQDLSVAGHRKGLIDANGNVTRSGLFFTAVNIARWSKARYWLWENVPGAFSSNAGRDFAAVVEFMAGLDEVPVPIKGWGYEGCALGSNGPLEWGVLDAQWFGVAQRRRRVFALLDTGDWRSRPPILLEPEGLRGDTPPSRDAGESVAGTFKACASSGGWSNSADHAAAGYMQPVGRWWDGGQVSQTLDAVPSKGQTMPEKNRFPAVLQPFNIYGGNKRADRPEGGFYVRMDEETTKTLDAATGLNPICSQGGTAVLHPIICCHGTQDPCVSEHTAFALGRNNGGENAIAFAQNSRDEVRLMNGDGQIVGALAAEPGMKQTCYVAQSAVATVAAFKGGQGSAAKGIGYDEHVAPTLSSADSGSNRTPTLLNAMQVRRLTPVECERLQGFPDGYTAVPWRNKPPSECTDGPRYKALGNSMAVPVMRWIGEQIEIAELF